MNKKLAALEALNYLFSKICFDCDSNICAVENNGACQHFQKYKTIETELNELEEYKSILKDFGLENPQNLIDNLKIIKDSKFHEKLKAFEIIKGHGVKVIEYPRKCFLVDKNENLLCGITKEEYELLKEVLK